MAEKSENTAAAVNRTAGAVAAAAAAAVRGGGGALPDPVPVPTPDDIKGVVTVLINSAKAVTKQSAAEVGAWAVAMAPSFATFMAMERAGDPRAALVMQAARRTALMFAGNYGVRLLQ